jgi:serine protease Do
MSRSRILALMATLLLPVALALLFEYLGERASGSIGATHVATNGAHRTRLTSDLIHPSMVPSADLPLVDITTSKIPDGLTERGTSFYVGNGLWFAARHVVNTDCARIIMIVDGKNVDAQIVYLDENADLAILRAAVPSVPALAITDPESDPTDHAYAFGFPQGLLGATADSYLGRTRLKLGGRLAGTAPVLAWTELDRYPAELDSLAGISGGPIVDANGYVVGIMVAASVRRGRNYTVAPELLVEAERQARRGAPDPTRQPAHDVVASPVALAKSAKMLEQNARIVLTYCIPH